jgi:Na+(H+)/acetate symporter ActP
MVPIIISAATSLVAGLLLGGCTNSNDEISKTLMNRNAQLENQLAGTQLTLTGLAITAVILACGLGASIYINHTGGKRGKANHRQSAGK